MKCSLGISNFLEEIYSLSHSVVILYFFALMAEEAFLTSSCYSLRLCIQMGISLLFSFTLHFSSFLSYLLIIREMQIKITLRYHLTLVTWSSSKSVQTIHRGKFVEKVKPVTLLTGMQIDRNIMENSLESP